MSLNSNLTALAVIPGILIIAYVYKKDKVEKEPVGLVIRTIIAGGISCILAGMLESAEAQVLPQYPQGTLQYALLTSFAMAALCEETVKYIAMRIFTWKYPGFNYRFDGIVYGVASAVGFAILENVMYVTQYGFETGIVRAFTAVPLHASCGVFMGVFYAYSKQAAILGKSPAPYTLLALLVPMLLHGVYDTMAFMGQAGTMPLLVLVVIMYVVVIRTINKMSAEDYRSGFYPRARSIDIDMDRF